MNILLFDIDGVLVDDRGYRAGVAATVNHFCRLMGQGDLAPDAEAIEVFHAHGYTNEWDICPLAIGSIIASALRANPDLPLTPAPLNEVLAQFRPVRIAPIDYREWVSATRDRPGRPSERALAMLNDAVADLPLSGSARPAVASAFVQLLTDPYDFPNAPVTQVFQEYTLGSSLFEEVYRTRPHFELTSLLYDEDRSALSPSGNALLRELVKGGACVCVYTARPSLPPSDTIDWAVEGIRVPAGFPPEAELAMILVDLNNLPLIAMGRMQWLAARVGSKVEYLTKPAPVQALAAIFAAVLRGESEALRAAYRVVSEGDSTSMPIALWREPAEVWLVEDAVLGIHAAIGAVDLLRKRGVSARLHTLGIATGGPKAEALADLCEAILPNVNEAIAYIAERIRSPISAAQSPTSNVQPPPSNF
ncbi:MAG TPA: hypothetical protein VIK33_11585 [Anaerolineae bacterium]